MITGTSRRRISESGDEADLYSRQARRLYNWRPGVRAYIKRKTHKRERREGKREATS